MKFKLFTVVVILCANAVFAQSKAPIGLGGQANMDALRSRNLVIAFDDRYEGTKGSPFLLEEFAKANLLIDKEDLHEGIDVKFNVYEKNIVYLSGDGTPLVFDAKYVDYIELTDPVSKSVYKLQKLESIIAVQPNEANSLFLILHEGKKVKFTALPAKELVKADYKGSTYGTGRTYDEFFDKRTYYFVDQSGNVVKVKLNRKNLLNSLADKENEIKNYISKEKVDVSTEEGWVKVLAYYEKL